MEIQGDGTHFDIYGSIGSIAEAQTIIDALEESKKRDIKELVIKIHDSKTIPSNVIGCLLKMSNGGMHIKLFARDKNLFEIVEFLCLSDKIKIDKLF